MMLITIMTHIPSFQSTHPVWDATTPAPGPRVVLPVSIHASRMGCDRTLPGVADSPASFNPRIPYGMRPLIIQGVGRGNGFNPRIPYGMRRRRPSWSAWPGRFQSTHPVWDATAWKLTVDGQWCSCRFAPTCLSCCYFQVRSFYSNDVNVLKSRLYENRRSAENFL